MTIPEEISKNTCLKCGGQIKGLGSLQAKIIDGELGHIKCPEKVVTIQFKELREQIAKSIITLDGICLWNKLSKSDKEVWRGKADQILSLDGLYVEVEGELPKCLQCGQELRRVMQSADSPLNQDQFDSVKAGDWYCDHCIGGEAKETRHKYWWNSELNYSEPSYKKVRPTKDLVKELE